MPKTWHDLHLVCFGCLLFNGPPVCRDGGNQWNTYIIVVSDFLEGLRRFTLQQLIVGGKSLGLLPGFGLSLPGGFV